MMEHSPVTQPLKPAGFCCLKPNPNLEVNEHAWTRATTMLYVEHPWGTGFSYGRPEPATEIEASGDLYAFVQNFFVVFPDLAARKIYIFGESYAGMFVPSILHHFHHENLKKDKPEINIAGGAIVSHFQSGITLLLHLYVGLV
jgi:carboxypeptidase C (cathepsin A)